MAIKIENKLNEGIATTEYFIQKVGLTTAEPTFVLDIGGGSTEISYVLKGNIIFNDSVKFAGNNLILSSKNLFKKIVEEDIGKRFDDDQLVKIVKKFNLIFSSGDYLKRGWNDKMAEFYDDELYRIEVNFLNSIFFGSLMFYLGLHLSNYNRTDNSEKIQVALAGNGTRFLEIITQGNSLTDLSKNWNDFFLKMILSGYRVNGDVKNSLPRILELKFTEDPKKEVVYGLLYSKDLINDKDCILKKMLGLNLEYQEKIYNYFDWPEIKAVELSRATIDFNIFYEFIRQYWENVKVLKKDIRHYDIENHRIEESVKISLEKRGNVALASPLFFECVFAYMKEFTENLKN